jgi:hypothetical protein
MFKAAVYIEGIRLDLFDEETISVVSSVQNIDDISRNFNDYSQTFTVPASKRNNEIFRHFYNASINQGFDARVRHKAHIDIHTYPFKVGSIRLDQCITKDNKPVSYRLTFFGLLISLKELINEDYLTALYLSEYDKEYSAENIIDGLVTGFFDEDYIFPLISTERQWFYNSNSSVTTYTDTLANIAWNGSMVNHGLNWTSLRPALRVMVIIEAIESKYGITFSRDFLGTAPFDNLYLWLANKDAEEGLENIYKVVDYNTFNTWQPAIGSYNNSSGTYTPTMTGASKLRVIQFRTFSTDSVYYTIQLMNNDQVLEEQSGTGNLVIDKEFPGGFSFGANIYGRIITNTDKLIDQAYFEIDELSDDEVLNATKLNFSIEGATILTSEFMPKMKTLDFLTSLIKAFNLVVIPNSTTDFYINTLDNWYNEGVIYDITRYIDTSEIPVNRSKIYREIDFMFQEPETILAEQFAKTNPSAYGDLSAKLRNLDGTPLDGEVFEIQLDFEQIVYEKLINLNSNSITNVVYGLSLDKGLSKVIPEPHIFYAIKRNISANPIGILDDTGTKNQLNTTVFMPSHAESNFANYTFTFGSEINEHTGANMTNSLFKLYYEDYITDSFNIKRRMYEITAKLPIWIISKLKLNDKLLIRSDRYIINQMTTEVTGQNVRFELLNDIYGGIGTLVIDDEVIPPPPPVIIPADSFSISSLGGNTQLEGCEQTINVTKYWGGLEPFPTLADTIYNNSAKTIVFNGGNKFYKIAGNKVLWINNSGVVMDVFFCSGGGGGGSQ